MGGSQCNCHHPAIRSLKGSVKVKKMEEIADMEYETIMISFRLFQCRSLVIREFARKSRAK